MNFGGAARAVLAVLFVVLGATHALAKEIVIPPLSGRVVDQAGILGSSEESNLTGKLAALEQKTTIQLVVVTLKSLQNRNIEEWGLALGRGWGIGQAGKNNGVLLIVAPAERELRIEVGYGLEGTLPDATADSIIRNVIVPRFKAGNMVGGINDGVDAIGRALTGEKLEFSKGRPSAARSGLFALIPFLFVFAFLLVAGLIRAIRRFDDDDTSDGRSRSDDSDSGWVWSSDDSGSSGSSWSSSSSGGGFSGGGGSFGGGGASGKW